ncbi:helix-turn-helix domain-containing protein [Salmonella enterica]|nr:helix-turn-helix domain-containing protein [Salmonella enterica]EEA7790223.1 helix-turn-helix domain-containing protein [Salmonella enterica subsp. enterica serovar Cerro]EEH7186472.1 helix-turn-helix domain-containing protein [Salmonella enterica subsp. enterica]EKG4721349.1 helix-turn-helix domain-containing protein [Salmonella enterica subsp. enterica serovar Muenster]
MNTTYQNVTEKAVRTIGSVSAVARKFGFKSSQSVANWIIRNKVPSERVISLCEFGGWVVTPHELRPDLHPTPTSGIPEDAITTGEGGDEQP